MLDIALFREGGDLEKVRASQRGRCCIVSKEKALAAAKASGDAAAIEAAQAEHDAALARQNAEVAKVDEIVAKDDLWRKVQFDVNQASKEQNAFNKEAGLCAKNKDEAGKAKAMENSKACKAKIAELKASEAKVKDERDLLLKCMGNILHHSVPNNDDEDDPVLGDPSSPETNVHMMHGDCTVRKKYNHVDLMRMLDIMDVERGTKVAGGRGYFLKGDGVLLNQAIIQMALAHLSSKGYTPLQTPFFMNRDAMAQCAQLSDFHEALYKVSGDEGSDDLKYLIATSEQPIACYHSGEKLDVKEFPIRYVGYSTCFRKEAGKHGKDTLGVFRTHQFEKVEQFVLTNPEEEGENGSWAEMDRMLANSADFYKALEIPFRVVNIVSGELNDAAAKKYDLEAWFPGGGAFRELVSCSNCTDYQSRRLDVRYGNNKGAPHCHMLNSTLSACERTMCCLVENYQTEEGIVLPEPLRPFFDGREMIRFKYRLGAKDKLEKI